MVLVDCIYIRRVARCVEATIDFDGLMPNICQSYLGNSMEGDPRANPRAIPDLSSLKIRHHHGTRSSGGDILQVTYHHRSCILGKYEKTDHFRCWEGSVRILHLARTSHAVVSVVVSDLFSAATDFSFDNSIVAGQGRVA